MQIRQNILPCLFLVINIEISMHFMKFEVYVPLTHVDAVKDAICKAGAGKYGNYDSCLWQTEGVGQFRPLEGSNPYLGTTNKVETTKEAKIECIVEESLIKNVIAEMKKAHPYEVPAFNYWPVFIE